jgi:cation diffusion facilitator family transporter
MADLTPTPATDAPELPPAQSERIERGTRAAQLGVLVNAGLAVVKLLTGLLGHSYALVADAIESSVDVLGSLVVWGGLRITARPADEDYPYGYGRAESLVAAVIALMLLGASASIAIASVREIITPHHAPAPYTLVVLALVVLVKEGLFRRVLNVGETVGSTAVRADAWHHRSDALTSAAAFLGISIALIGGPGWESADDWAALAAAAIIAFNGISLLRPAIRDLMDRAPDSAILDRIEAAACAVPDVRATEKLKVRRHGLAYLADLHVQADPELSLAEAHALGGRVRAAIRESVPEVADVLIHMEPFRGGSSSSDASPTVCDKALDDPTPDGV